MARSDSLAVLLPDSSAPPCSVLAYSAALPSEAFLKMFSHGHYRVLGCESKLVSLNEQLDAFQPDLLVLHLQQVNTSILTALQEVKVQRPLPVIVFVDEHQERFTEQVVAAGVHAYITDGLKPDNFDTIVKVARARFVEQGQLLRQLARSETKLAERKLIDRAKGLLMAQQGITEQQAYVRLRKMAMDKGLSMGKLSQNIIDVMTVLD